MLLLYMYIHFLIDPLMQDYEIEYNNGFCLFVPLFFFISSFDCFVCWNHKSEFQNIDWYFTFLQFIILDCHPFYFDMPKGGVVH